MFIDEGVNCGLRSVGEDRCETCFLKELAVCEVQVTTCEVVHKRSFPFRLSVTVLFIL